jgi:hypothetical protein
MLLVLLLFRLEINEGIVLLVLMSGIVVMLLL